MWVFLTLIEMMAVVSTIPTIAFVTQYTSRQYTSRSFLLAKRRVPHLYSFIFFAIFVLLYINLTPQFNPLGYQGMVVGALLIRGLVLYYHAPVSLYEAIVYADTKGKYLSNGELKAIRSITVTPTRHKGRRVLRVVACETHAHRYVFDTDKLIFVVK